MTVAPSPRTEAIERRECKVVQQQEREQLVSLVERRQGAHTAQPVRLGGVQRVSDPLVETARDGAEGRR